MITLTNITIKSIDEKNHHITASFEFSDSSINITHTIGYGFSSHDEDVVEEIKSIVDGEEVITVKVRKVLVKHPLMDIKDPEDVKKKLADWARAYIWGKEQEQSTKDGNSASQEVKDLVGKKISIDNT